MTIATRFTMALACGACLAAVLARPASAQNAQTKQVMREKLARSGPLLAALVTSNWAELERDTRALDAVTAKPGWEVLRSPEYAKQTQAFHVAIQALTEAAGQRDLQVALRAYNGLVSSCVECHRFVARSRVALGLDARDVGLSVKQ
jgi:cell division septation protein DedD